MAIDPETVAVVRDAVKRVLEGREAVPGDLPYPPAINEYMLATVWPDTNPRRAYLTRAGVSVAKAARQVYVAGYLAGRACDGQIGRQVREALGVRQADAATTHHPYVGVAVCLVCDRSPDDPVHANARRAGDPA
jgi:hypothetical protein